MYAEWEHGDSSTHSRYVTTFYICAPWKLFLNNTKLPERFQVLICPVIFIVLNQLSAIVICRRYSTIVYLCPRARSYVHLLAVERWEQRLEEGYTAAYNLLPPLSQFSKELILSWRADFTTQLRHQVLSALSSSVWAARINIGQLTEVVGRNNIEQLTGKILRYDCTDCWTWITTITVPVV